MAETRIIFSTWPDAETAERAAREVVQANLAACANILPGAVSIYRWDDKVMRDPECIMILKTSTDTARALVQRLAAIHPYDTPALTALPIEAAQSHQAFLDWIKAVTNSA